MEHTQYVLIEFKNSIPMIEKIKSTSPITIDDVLKYYVENYDFNEERDSLTFVDEPDEVKI